MKSSIALSLLAASLFITSCQNETKDKDNGITLGALHVSKAAPSPGDKLDIVYNATDDKDSSVIGYYYYLVNTKVYPQDLQLKDSMNIWKATLQVPDSATAIAFNFKTNDTFDTNQEKGYIFPLFDEEGKIVPGGNASAGYYPAWISRFGVEIVQDSALSMIGNDLKMHPKIEKDWDNIYAMQLYRTDSEKGENYIKERIAYYKGLENLTEEDYSTLIQMHRMLQNSSKADSLRMVAVKNFPNGDAAKAEYFMNFRKVNDLATQEKMLAEFDAKFGEGQYKDMMLQSVASAYLNQGDLEKFLEFSRKISDKSSQASLYNNHAWNYAEKGEYMDFAEKISKKSLELLEAAKKDTKQKPELYTQNQYVANLNRNYEMYADTYAYILFKQGKSEEALTYQKIAVGDGTSSELNERYLQYLIAAQKWELAETTAAEYIKENTATAKTKEYFKTAYLKVNGSEKGLQEKLTKLENEAQAKALAEVKKEVINEPSPDFTMKDAAGNEISLASLKGKTVILDFWATWCGPCKASFPGMQVAVEKYKNDPSVAFFFVNTFETAPSLKERQKKVANFIESHQYNFHVLYDQPEKENSRNFLTAQKYGITGIPTKIILGPNGNIMFKEVGYGGNNERMVQKIDMMIELSKS